jgi:hypothetical protein
MNQILQNITSYLLSFIIGIIIIVYIFNIPQWITNNTKLIKYYYYDNMYPHLLWDFFFVSVYLLICYFIISYLKIQNRIYQFLIIIVITFMITSLFCYYYLSKPLNQSQFFSIWFHTVKYRSAVYDVILIGFIFIVYILFNKYLL